jgi:hypothetical protein
MIMDAQTPSPISEQDPGSEEIFLPVTDLPPDFIDRWILAVPRKTIRIKLVFRDGRLLIAVGGLPRHRHEELERWLACHKREIFCG